MDIGIQNLYIYMKQKWAVKLTKFRVKFACLKAEMVHSASRSGQIMPATSLHLYP